MKVQDNGCFYSVTVSAFEVDNFNSRWPCSPIPRRSIWFQFDKRNGDLVDIRPGLSQDFDGDALLALSQDAQAHGKKTLALRDKRNAARRERDGAMRDIGLLKVKGAMGGTYWE
jgi:hypothetical protein